MHQPDFKESEALGIPTYEEAVLSRPHSSRSFQGPQETSDDAERQTLLLGNNRLGEAEDVSGRRRYQPIVEDARASEDSIDMLSGEVDADDGRELAREIEQMDIVEAGHMSQQSSRARRRMLPGLSKRIADITESLSALRLPSVRMPFSKSFQSVFSMLQSLKPGWSMIARVTVFFAILAIVYALVVMRVITWKVVPSGGQYVPENVRNFVQNSVDPDFIKKYLYEVTYDDHVAGTKGDFFLAEWIHDLFMDAGLDEVYYDDYEVYLNYPKPGGRRVAIVSPQSLTWEAIIEEDTVEGKEGQHQVPAFHGHSKSGNVTGPLVYANYGAREDFEYLKMKGIDLHGAIILVKYQGTQGDRAQKVKAAELAGAAGCLIYSDPKDDGFLRGEPWPHGPWRTPDSLERGSVALTSWAVGDVLTPGWASTPDADRISLNDANGLVKIPSLPLAWRDAQTLLQSLDKCGMRVPDNWIGGVPEVAEWWTGDARVSPVVNLMNLQDENTKQPIRNVLGRIEGIEDPQKIIYVGNHRDAWCYGAVDPGSGTAVMLEVVRVFGDLLAHGWRPRRTIVFASWDAEEYNLIGSTEHVEKSIDSIREDAVAYLNVDVAVAGQKFRAAGSPVFQTLLLYVLRRVLDPDESGYPLFEAWNVSSSRLEGLGAGSDYVAFQDLAGCSSLDFGFEGPNGYPYHSCYETFDWMDKIGDPGFTYHAALAKVWGLLLLELADEPLLPFDFIAYANEVSRYVSELKDEVAAASSAQHNNGTSQFTNPGKLDTTALEEAADLFQQIAPKFLRYEDQWALEVERHGMMENGDVGTRRLDHNARAAAFDTHLLDLPPEEDGRIGGIPGREQFKHVIHGPQKWSGYEEEVFPAIRDKMAEGDWEGAQEMVGIVAGRLKFAVERLIS